MSEKQDLALEALMDFFDAVEAGIAQAKQHLKEAKVPEKTKANEEKFDFSLLFWEKNKGKKARFNRQAKKRMATATCGKH
jgi:hypothetical protein